MYPVSSEVAALFESEQKQVLRITGRDRNRTNITITDADVMAGTFYIDRFSCNGEKLEVGTAISAEMSVVLNNENGAFDDIVFEGTELFVEIGVADWDDDDPTITYVPCGYFTPDHQPRKMTTIDMKALDRMVVFDVTKAPLQKWKDENETVITDEGNHGIYFQSSVSFPATVAQIVQQVCDLCNIEMGDSVSWRSNASTVISALPDLQEPITYRNILQWCAGVMGTNAWIDWRGKICFSRYNNSTTYNTTTANRFSSDLYENDITITGYEYTNIQGVNFLRGSSDYTLDLTGNYFAENNTYSILGNLYTNYRPTYRPFSAMVKPAPYLWPMDQIVFTDKDGNEHTGLLTNVHIKLNGPTAIESCGRTNQSEEGALPSGMTTNQAYYIEKAVQSALNSVDESFTQEEIFNRLTNNGESQGLILYNNKVYLNADYIRTGTLVADLIKGGILKLGGYTNENGMLQIVDANNTVIGTWDQNGITATDGTFANINIVSGEIELRQSPIFGFNVSQYGDLAIGTKPANLLYFEDNKCGFQVNNYGDVKIGENLFIYGVQSQGQNYFKMGKIYGCKPDSDIGIPYGIRINDEGDNIRLHISHSGIKMWGGVVVNSDFSVGGTKSRLCPTDEYSNRLLYCYETSSPMFGDVGDGTIGDDGLCYVSIDAVFAQTVTTTQYQVFLQKYGAGDCWVKERNGAYFVVEGTPNLSFGWELKAKQRDYDQRRLDVMDEPFTMPEQTYAEDAVNYINNLRKERETA